MGRAQLALEDLSARVLGQLVGDDDVARGLEAGEAVAAEARDLLGGQLVAGARHDDGGDGLDPARVGDAEHGRLGHRRVRVDDLLDLARGDVLAARLDHVLLAVDDVEVALVVEDAEVAGVQPAVAERLGRLGGVVPVAEHRLRRAVHDLADLAGAGPGGRRRRRPASRRSAPGARPSRPCGPGPPARSTVASGDISVWP